VSELERLVDVESRLREAAATVRDGEPAGLSLLFAAKRAAFSDRDIATLTGTDAASIAALRRSCGLEPGYAMVDTCAAEFRAETPYFYSTYAATGSDRRPTRCHARRARHRLRAVRIGQGIEFDYCAVQAADTLRRAGYAAVMINSNPETVSTDFDASTRLYFEPLDAESVLSVLHAEQPRGRGRSPVAVQFGGQTPLNLARRSAPPASRCWRWTLDMIDAAEERVRFAALVERLGIPQPEGGMARSFEEALVVADRIGYPVMVRPSFVIGGLAIDVATAPTTWHVSSRSRRPWTTSVRSGWTRTSRASRWTSTRSPTGARAHPGLIEHVERAGVHSGDSVGILPPQRISGGDQALIVEAMTRVTLALGVRGLVNAQFIVRHDGVYLIEVNPRASRTVPFTSKVTGVPMVELAVRVALGEDLVSLGWPAGLLPEPPVVAVKAPVFSTAKLRGVDPSLGRSCSPRARSSGSIRTPTSRWRRRSPRHRSARRCPYRRRHRDGLDRGPGQAMARRPRRGARGRGLSVHGDERHGPRAARPGPRRDGGVARRRRARGPRDDRGRHRRRLGVARGEHAVAHVRTGPRRRGDPTRGDRRGHPVLTSIETAVAAARSLDPRVRERMAEVRTIDGWRTRRTRGRPGVSRAGRAHTSRRRRRTRTAGSARRSPRGTTSRAPRCSSRPRWTRSWSARRARGRWARPRARHRDRPDRAAAR
jgi:carbamoylphosphate synthase large subunit